MKKSFAIRDLLSTQADAQLKPLLIKAAQIDALNNAILQHLPKTLAKHCRVINFAQGKLTLAVDNSSIATKLRFQLPELLSYLRSQPPFAGITSIHHLLQPAELVTPQRAKPPAKKLGKEAIEALQTCAEHSADPELQQQLRIFLEHQKIHNS